jgi:protein-disulfide isomerase
MRLNAIALALTASLVIAGCSKAQEAPVDKAFGDKVRAYLLQHPEVIKEAIDKYNADQEKTAAEEARAAIGVNRQALERDARDFVANPNGKVTVTEFYDYRCPHCSNVAPQVVEFIAKNPDVRVVFKELPIFGGESDRAALAALAVKRAGGDYMAAHKAMMATKGLDDPAILRIMTQHGASASALSNPNADDVKHLADVRALASKIGVTGTPAFIIGDSLIPGEDMESVQAAVDAAKKN